MGKQRRIWPAVLLTAAIGGGACLVLLRSAPEPLYEGRPLSYWLEGYRPSLTSAKQRKKVDEAVRQAGTNAFPILFRLLRRHNSTAVLKLVALAQKQQFVPIHFTPASVRNAQAGAAFFRLGAGASNAVPTLIKILRENCSADSEIQTLYALEHIGPAAANAVPTILRCAADPEPNVRQSSIQALARIVTDPAQAMPLFVRALGDPNGSVQIAAVEALGSLGTAAKPAVPALLQSATNSTAAVRHNSLKSLGLIRTDAEHLVPALICGLKDPDLSVRSLSLQMLGNFGMAATSAVPALIAEAGNPQFQSRETIISTLKRIDPEAAKTLAEEK